MNDHDAWETEESGAVWDDVTPEERAALDEVLGPEDVDLNGYQCTDARLGKYICCGQKINPEFVCWETTMNKPNLYDVRIHNGRVEYFDGTNWVPYRRVR